MSAATAALGTGLKRTRDAATSFQASPGACTDPCSASCADRTPTVSSLLLPPTPTSTCNPATRDLSPSSCSSDSPSSHLTDSMTDAVQASLHSSPSGTPSPSPSPSPSSPAVHSPWRHSPPQQPLCGTYADIGGRGYMEDRHLCTQIDSAAHDQPVTVAAVFDGHGSSLVAEFLEGNMAGFIQQELEQNHSSDAVALHKAYLAADAALKQAQASRSPVRAPTSSGIQDDMGGSTAVVVLCSQEAIICANCGDSRAVLARGGCQAIPLSDDHRPDRSDEMARINEAGGCVMHFCGCPRVMGVLAMSRALGDLWLQRFGVIASPEVKAVPRDAQDEFVIVASDGLWVAVSNEEAVHLARRCLRRAASRGASRASCLRIAAKVLAQLAAQRGNKDNITVLLVDLQQPATRSAQWPGQDAGAQYQEGSAAEESLLQLCTGRSDGASALAALAAPASGSSHSDSSPTSKAPATPRVNPPPNAAVGTPRNPTPRSQSMQAKSSPSMEKAAALNAIRRSSLDAGEVLCNVRVRTSPWAADECKGLQ